MNVGIYQKKTAFGSCASMHDKYVIGFDAEFSLSGSIQSSSLT